MSLVTAGEISAMGILYERYKKPLYAYFFKVSCGDIHLSEDLVQTVFYRAIRYKSSFTGQGSFAKWLFTIAHNASIDFKKKNRNIMEYKADMLQDSQLDYADQEEKDEERIKILEAAIGRLEKDDRELVVLCKIECLRYSDVAEILGISEGNVKIRMFRVLQKLRDICRKLEKSNYETITFEKKTGNENKAQT